MVSSAFLLSCCRSLCDGLGCGGDQSCFSYLSICDNLSGNFSRDRFSTLLGLFFFSIREAQRPKKRGGGRLCQTQCFGVLAACPNCTASSHTQPPNQLHHTLVYLYIAHGTFSPGPPLLTPPPPPHTQIKNSDVGAIHVRTSAGL